MGPTARDEMQYLSLSEVARALAVSERTVTRWIQSGKLAASKPGRDYRIPESAVRQLVEETRVSPKPPPPPAPPPPPSTPRTDEPEREFKRRFEVLSGPEADELRAELDGEYVALLRQVKRLRAVTPPEEVDQNFALRRAAAKWERCSRRLSAVTFLWTELTILGRERQSYAEYSNTVGSLERLVLEKEEEERLAASGEASGASA